MPFEPFGYPFEVRSPRPPAEVKARIRSRKKGWFEVKSGARGWIAGPFICLWYSAFDQHGPMLLGLISSDGAGTRIGGRAGSDLNRVLLFSLLFAFLTPVMMFMAYELIGTRSALLLPLSVGAAVFLVAAPLVYWAAHKDRRQGEPLVRFVSDAMTDSDRTPRRKSAPVTIRQGLALSIGGDAPIEAIDSVSIHDALVGVEPDGFVILESGPETYIQTAFRHGGYVVEKREGNGQEHFRALRRTNNPVTAKRPNDVFDFEEAREIFMAYASGASAPLFLTWERMLLP